MPEKPNSDWTRSSEFWFVLLKLAVQQLTLKSPRSECPWKHQQGMGAALRCINSGFHYESQHLEHSWSLYQLIFTQPWSDVKLTVIFSPFLIKAQNRYLATCSGGESIQILYLSTNTTLWKYSITSPALKMLTLAYYCLCINVLKSNYSPVVDVVLFSTSLYRTATIRLILLLIQLIVNLTWQWRLTLRLSCSLT